jgi:hypothetical protein
MPGPSYTDMSISTLTQPPSSQSVQNSKANIEVQIKNGNDRPSQVLSTQLLQSSVADREAERERRRKNGNVPPREDKPGGKNLDQTCLRLVIERPGSTSGGRV